MTRGNQTEALVLAGYKGERESLTTYASKLFADDRVRAAIREQCLRRIDIVEVEVMETTLDIMRDGDASPYARLKAAAMIWDRANPVMNRLKIDVEHHLSQDEIDVQHFLALKQIGAPANAFLARFGVNGLPRVEALVAAKEQKARLTEGTTIDVEYTELPDEAPVTVEESEDVE